MITIDLRDKNLIKNVKTIQEIRKSGLFTDSEIQEKYNEQVKKDKEEKRGRTVIINLEFHDGRQKIVPMVERLEVKEYHIVMFQEDGKTDIEVRSSVDKMRIVGV